MLAQYSAKAISYHASNLNCLCESLFLLFGRTSTKAEIPMPHDTRVFLHAVLLQRSLVVKCDVLYRVTLVVR